MLGLKSPKKYIWIGLCCIFLGAALTFESLAYHVYLDTKIPLKHPLPRVGHAGGEFQGQAHTNSIEALEKNASYYEVFELDFRQTADGVLVCNHHVSHGPAIETLTFAEFENQNNNHPIFRACTVSTLRQWMDRNPSKRIITDVKGDNIATLKYIADHFPDFENRFIAQIFDPSQYAEVRALGYRDIIWSLYRYKGDANEVLQNIRAMDLYAVALWDKKKILRTRILVGRLNHLGIPTYVHTINTADQWHDFRALGATEIYTDRLVP
jgi:glycerophosphoryl diester phosphodiesterase